MSKKKKVSILPKKELLRNFSVRDIVDGSLDKCIEKLTEIKHEFETFGYVNLTIDAEQCYGYYDEQWTELNIYGYKPLTVKEFVESPNIVGT